MQQPLITHLPLQQPFVTRLNLSTTTIHVHIYLVVYIEQHEVVPSRHEEVLSGCIGVNDLVLGSVEDGVVDGQHGADRQDLLRALIPGGQTTIYYRSGIDTLISS